MPARYFSGWNRPCCGNRRHGPVSTSSGAPRQFFHAGHARPPCRLQLAIQQVLLLSRPQKQIAVQSLEFAIDHHLFGNRLNPIDGRAHGFRPPVAPPRSPCHHSMLIESIVDRADEVGRGDLRHAADQRAVFDDGHRLPSLHSKYAVVSPAIPAPTMHTSASTSDASRRQTGILAVADQTDSC